MSAKAEKLGIKFGGIWQEFHENILACEEKRASAESKLAVAERDRDALKTELALMSIKFETIMSSLTNASTSHMETKQIVSHIRREKEEMTSRCLSLESQREWLESQVKQLRAQEIELTEQLSDAHRCVELKETMIGEKHRETISLKSKVSKCEDIIAALKQHSQKHQNDAIIFHKALVAKDRQLEVILKERNRLRAELERLQKDQSQPRRPTATTAEATAAGGMMVGATQLQRQQGEDGLGLPVDASPQAQKRQEYRVDDGNNHKSSSAAGDAPCNGASQSRLQPLPSARLDELMREYGNPWDGPAAWSRSVDFDNSSGDCKRESRFSTAAATTTTATAAFLPADTAPQLRPRSATPDCKKHTNAGTGSSSDCRQRSSRNHPAVAEDVSPAKERERLYIDTIKKLKVQLAAARNAVAAATKSKT